MLEFNEELIYTGMQSRTKKNTGEIYDTANFLGENGKTFEIQLTEKCKKQILNSGLETLDKALTTLKIIPGYFNEFKLLEIEKA